MCWLYQGAGGMPASLLSGWSCCVSCLMVSTALPLPLRLLWCSCKLQASGFGWVVRMVAYYALLG